MTNEKIQPFYIENKNIDKVKWDACISNAANGLVYGYSFYLDLLSAHWDGLVLNNYEAVMPVTWNKKYGIYYLYQPFFTASLGVFGNNLSADIIQIFLENVPAKFRYWDIYLNHGNLFSIAGFKINKRSNYILSLENKFATIADRFSQNHKRNIKKAEKQALYVEKNIDAKKVVSLAKGHRKIITTVGDKDYQRLLAIYRLLHQQGNAVSYGVYNKQDVLISASLFFFSHNRVYFILSANHPSGRNSGSSHFMINEFIKDHAGQKLFLDFEGSDVKSVARFYIGFGAVEENYPAIKLNSLPGVVKLFKK